MLLPDSSCTRCWSQVLELVCLNPHLPLIPERWPLVCPMEKADSADSRRNQYRPKRCAHAWRMEPATRSPLGPRFQQRSFQAAAFAVGIDRNTRVSDRLRFHNMNRRLGVSPQESRTSPPIQTPDSGFTSEHCLFVSAQRARSCSTSSTSGFSAPKPYQGSWIAPAELCRRSRVSYPLAIVALACHACSQLGIEST